jgi:hypothetical protein
MEQGGNGDADGRVCCSYLCNELLVLMIMYCFSKVEGAKNSVQIYNHGTMSQVNVSNKPASGGPSDRTDQASIQEGRTGV